MFIKNEKIRFLILILGISKKEGKKPNDLQQQQPTWTNFKT